MRPGAIAIVGAAETTKFGKIPDVSQLQLHAGAALNVMADAGLGPKDIDGVATAGESPANLAHYLGITPTWADGTNVGGCSFMLHVRHAAAISEGFCDTVLIARGESGLSNVGRGGYRGAGGASFGGQFEAPFGVMGPTSMFTIPFLRYMQEAGTTLEQLAMVAVVQREWAGLNPRASYREPLSVEQVMNDRMIAYPFTKLECCLVTD
jgi:acetyl-CoA acetyltransferase